MSEERAPTPTPQELSVIRYKEELAKEMGLPSSYQMGILRQFCEDLVQSGLVPTYFKQNPMAVFLAVMRGREMNIAPVEAVLETFWATPQGRLGMYANKMLDIMQRRGVKAEFRKEDAEGCEILFTPPNDHPPYLASFYYPEAQRAGLVRSDGNWIKWPSDMCRSRAISRGWRVISGTFGGANLYSRDELEDMEEKTPAVSTPAPLEAEFKVGRRSRKAEPTPEPAPAVPVTAPPSAPEYSIYTCNLGILQKLNEEPHHSDLATAGLRAQALANQTGIDHAVLDFYTQDLQFKATAPRVATPPPPPKADPKPPPPVPEPSLVESIKAKMNAIKTKLGGGRPASVTLNSYLRAYMEVVDLPKDPSLYLEPIDRLGDVLSKPGWNVLIENPAALAAKLSGRSDPLGDELFRLKWIEEPIIQAARSLYAALNFRNVSEFRAYVEATGVDMVPNEDAVSYMRVACRIRDAASLLDLIEKNVGVTFSQAVQEIESQIGRIEDASPEAIRKEIQAIAQTLQPGQDSIEEEGLPFGQDSN